MASWFNYASMSHNTHMFFSTLVRYTRTVLTSYN